MFDDELIYRDPTKPSWYYTERDPIWGTTAYEEEVAYRRWIKQNGSCDICGESTPNVKLEATQGYCDRCDELLEKYGQEHRFDYTNGTQEEYKAWEKAWIDFKNDLRLSFGNTNHRAFLTQRLV